MKGEATFAAGCFWGVERGFAELPGVLTTEVGYAGGTKVDPTYKEVCSGTTGHAEAVHLTFDPDQITYQQLLEHFWSSHDPTQGDRQGVDRGHQYRSVIFFHSREQEEEALASRAQLIAQGIPITTEVVPAQTFYRAEEYHQKYFLQ